MHESFKDKKFTVAHMELIDNSVVIIDEYKAQGFELTLRQLYYQHVARGLIDNTQKEYKRLGVVISEARLCGLVDWSAIEDRTRNLETFAAWSSPSAVLDSAAHSFNMDL